MTDLKLVIFDCDGVLVNTETISNQILVDDLGPRGLELTLESCMDLFVGGTMAGVKVQVESMGIPLPDDWVSHIYEIMYARLREGVDPISGVSDVLDKLDVAGIPYCVASNGSLEKMGITLGHTGLHHRFNDAMFSAHVLKTAKPDPDLFLHAAAGFGVSPENCVVVEDSITGATAAKRAKMKCFGYAPHGNDDKLAEQDAIVFTDMSRLPRLLGLTA